MDGGVPKEPQGNTINLSTELKDYLRSYKPAYELLVEGKNASLWTQVGERASLLLNMIDNRHPGNKDIRLAEFGSSGHGDYRLEFSFKNRAYILPVGKEESIEVTSIEKGGGILGIGKKDRPVTRLATCTVFTAITDAGIKQIRIDDPAQLESVLKAINEHLVILQPEQDPLNLNYKNRDKVFEPDITSPRLEGMQDRQGKQLIIGGIKFEGEQIDHRPSPQSIKEAFRRNDFE